MKQSFEPIPNIPYQRSTVGETVAEFFGITLDEELLNKVGLFADSTVRTVAEAVLIYEESDKSRIKLMSVSYQIGEIYLADIQKSHSLSQLALVPIDEIPDFVTKKIVSKIRNEYLKKWEELAIIECRMLIDKNALKTFISEHYKTINQSDKVYEIVSMKMSAFIMDDIKKASDENSLRSIFDEMLENPNNIPVAGFVQDVLIDKMNTFESNRFRNGFFKIDATLNDVWEKYKSARALGLNGLLKMIASELDSDILFEQEFDSAAPPDLKSALKTYNYDKLQTKIINYWLTFAETEREIVDMYLYAKEIDDSEVLQTINDKWIEICQPRIVGVQNLGELNLYLDPIFEADKKHDISPLIYTLYDNFLNIFIRIINESQSDYDIENFNFKCKREGINHIALVKHFSMAEVIEEKIDIYLKASNESKNPYDNTYINKMLEEIRKTCLKEIEKSNSADRIREIFETTAYTGDDVVKEAAVKKVFELFSKSN